MQEIPCDGAPSSLRGANALLRLHGRWQPDDPPPPEQNASSASAVDTAGYPLVYWGVSTECRGCDLPPMAAVVDAGDATCLLLPITRGDFRLAGSRVEDQFPGPEVTIPCHGKPGAVFDVWLLLPPDANNSTNTTSASTNGSGSALVVQITSSSSSSNNNNNNNNTNNTLAPPPPTSTGFAYAVVLLCALAALWLGPLGCLLRRPAHAMTAALMTLARIGGAKARKGMNQVGVAVRACPAWVVGRWRRARREDGGGAGDEEAGLLRRPLLAGDAAGVEEGGGRGDDDDDALSLSSSSSSSESESEEEEEGEEEQQEQQEAEAESEVESPDSSTTTTAAVTPLAQAAPQPRPQQQPRPPPPCLAHCPGVVPGGVGPEAARFRPLDAFRGLALALWLFVENGGAGLRLFTPALWAGRTLADVPFLWAALAAGCALPFSSRRYREPPPPPPTRGRRARQQQQQHQLKRRRRLLRALWAATSRGLALFLLGLFLNNGRDVACWRVTGPLQALGFALWAVQVTGALLQYFCPPLASPSPSSSDAPPSSPSLAPTTATTTTTTPKAARRPQQPPQPQQQQQLDTDAGTSKATTGTDTGAAASDTAGAGGGGESALRRRTRVWARAITLEDQQRKEQDHLRELEDNLLRGAAPLLSSAPTSQQPQEEEQEEEQEQPLTDEPSEPEAQQPPPPPPPPQQQQQQEPAQETKEEEVEGRAADPAAAADEGHPQQERRWRLGKGRFLPSWPFFPSFSTATHWPWLRRPPSTHTESSTTTDSDSSSTNNSSSGNNAPKEPSPPTTSPWHRWLFTDAAAGGSALGRVQWREWPPALAVLAAIIVADVTARLPGCPRGYMGMGGRLVDGGVYWACTGGIHRLVDLSVLGAAHTAAAGDEPAASLYWTEPFDRYGVVNALVLAAVVALVAATVGGRACLRAHEAAAAAAAEEEEEGQGADGGSKTMVVADRGARFPRARPSVAALWAALGAGLVALSFLLEHAAGIPPVPALLTPSFLGWALGTGLLALAALYVLMGTPPLSALLRRRRGRCCWKGPQRQEEGGAQEHEHEPEPWTAPALVALGRNPLLVYAGHCLLRRRFPFGMDVASASSSAGGGTVVEGLAAGCLGVASWAAVAWALERRGIVFRA